MAPGAANEIPTLAAQGLATDYSREMLISTASLLAIAHCGAKPSYNGLGQVAEFTRWASSVILLPIGADLFKDGPILVISSLVLSGRNRCRSIVSYLGSGRRGEGRVRRSPDR
jgi:hypothetical protein